MGLQSLDLEAASETPIEVKIKHPVTNEPIKDGDEAFIVWVYGKDSKQWADAMKRLKARYKGQELDGEAISELVVQTIQACTVRWTGVIWDDKPLECTPESIKMVFQKPGFYWLVAQILVAAGDRSNLFLEPKSS